MKKYNVILIVLGFLASCGKSNLPKNAEGFKPIYENDVNDIKVTTNSPVGLKNLGRIFYTPSNQYIYLNEINKGIHVIDNSNPKSPLKKHFINIEGNTDFYIKENVLYASSHGRIFSIDISDIVNPKILGSVKLSAENYIYQKAPPMLSNAAKGDKVYFECPIDSKGKVVGWKKANVENPKCYIQK